MTVPAVGNASAAGQVARGVTTPTTDSITFYWRPGCGFCMMLRRRLSQLGLPLDERNIWEDPDAAAAVRAVTGGSETVPTVVIGDVALVNPPAAQVLDTVRTDAPHLEPRDDEARPAGLLDRVLGIG